MIQNEEEVEVIVSEERTESDESVALDTIEAAEMPDAGEEAAETETTIETLEPAVIPHVEALVFASDKPLSVADITELMNGAFAFMDQKMETSEIQSALDALLEKYSDEKYPFEIRESGGGWQFLTKRYYHKTVAQLNGEKYLKKLSAAALETLAIVAYKQPVTKGEIENIRGVSTDYAIQKLLEKDLIHITGRNEKLPGQPLIYETSRNFMDYFGINSADDLPKIKDVLSHLQVEPTVVSDELDEHGLMVSESGELDEAEGMNQDSTNEKSDFLEENESTENESQFDEPLKTGEASDSDQDEEAQPEMQTDEDDTQLTKPDEETT